MDHDEKILKALRNDGYVAHEHSNTCKYNKKHICDMDPKLKAQVSKAIKAVYATQECEESRPLCACRAVAEIRSHRSGSGVVCCIACYQARAATTDVLAAHEVREAAATIKSLLETCEQLRKGYRDMSERHQEMSKRLDVLESNNASRSV